MKTAVRITLAVLAMFCITASPASALSELDPVHPTGNVDAFYGTVYPGTPTSPLTSSVHVYIGNNQYRKTHHDANLFVKNGTLQLRMVEDEFVVSGNASYGIRGNAVYGYVAWDGSYPLPVTKMLKGKDGKFRKASLTSVNMSLFNPNRPAPPRIVK